MLKGLLCASQPASLVLVRSCLELAWVSLQLVRSH